MLFYNLVCINREYFVWQSHQMSTMLVNSVTVCYRSVICSGVGCEPHIFFIIKYSFYIVCIWLQMFYLTVTLFL